MGRHKQDRSDSAWLLCKTGPMISLNSIKVSHFLKKWEKGEKITSLTYTEYDYSPFCVANIYWATTACVRLCSKWKDITMKKKDNSATLMELIYGMLLEWQTYFLKPINLVPSEHYVLSIIVLLLLLLFRLKKENKNKNKNLSFGLVYLMREDSMQFGARVRMWMQAAQVQSLHVSSSSLKWEKLQSTVFA